MDSPADEVAPAPEHASSYTPRHRRYYQAHREEILKRKSEAKPWVAYYQANAEKEKERQRQRYWARKAAVAAAAPGVDPTPQT